MSQFFRRNDEIQKYILCSFIDTFLFFLLFYFFIYSRTFIILIAYPWLGMEQRRTAKHSEYPHNIYSHALIFFFFFLYFLMDHPLQKNSVAIEKLGYVLLLCSYPVGCYYNRFDLHCSI